MLALLFAYASLADPVYETREAATARLTEQVGRHPAIYGPPLASWVASCSCPETRTRCLLVLTSYTRWRVDSYVPSTVPLFPICDTFPLPNALLPAFTLEDVRDRGRWPVTWHTDSRGGPHWSSYRRTTEAKIREAIRDGMSHDDASELLRRMWHLERRSRHDCGLTTLEVRGWVGYLR